MKTLKRITLNSIVLISTLLLMGFTPKDKTFSDIVRCQGNDQDSTYVGVCHRQGQSKWIYKLIKENALNGHLKHGDFLYKGRPDVYDWEMDDWCQINAPTN